jgi:hypothetical protein
VVIPEPDVARDASDTATDSGAGAEGDIRSLRLRIFAWFWALAALMHMFGTFTLSRVRYQFDWLAFVDLAIAVVAVIVLLRPRATAALIGLLLLCPISAWLGAPRVGNHWLLVAVIDLALVCSVIPMLWSRTRPLLGRLHDDGLPIARLMFVVFYMIAAISKVNSSFLDPTVSCSTLFFGHLLESAGVRSIDPMVGSSWSYLVPILALAIELTTAVLLCFGRTRLIAAVMLITFHGVIAFDTLHQFADFAAVVAALAVLMLPDGAFVWFRRVWTDRRRQLLLLRSCVVAVVILLLVAQLLDRADRHVRLFDLTRNLLWWAVWSGLLASVLVWIVVSRARRADVSMLPANRSLLLWPGVVALIGIGPYLGVRTATSWNMYSNLRTVDGSSNSYLLPVTAGLNDAQIDAVRILGSSDPGLQAYVDSGFVLPWINLRDHTSTSRDAAITFERNGQRFTVEHTRSDPELSRPVPWWDSKVFAFRSYVPTGPSTCQDSMLSAR